MKKILMAAALAGALLSGCKSTQLGSGTDDVYVNPAEERQLAQKAREEAARKEAEERASREAEAAAKKAAEENNPYYKDPSYDADDYYDYEYASRINRFQRPIPGAGFYDPYYTNMYTYNQNPGLWGTSIYASYNWGMPSYMFNGYSMGISTGWGYGYPAGYYGYNSWNCYPGFYDPFCASYGWGYGYNPYFQPWGYGGYYSGYNQGYYNGWNNGYWNGYYNSLDPNSGYGRANVGPRSSSGSNTGRSGLGPDESLRSKYIRSVAEEQMRTERFSGPRTTRSSSAGRMQSESGDRGGRVSGGNQPVHQEAPQQDRSRRSNSSGRIQEQGRSREGRQQQPQQNENINQAPSGGRGSNSGRESQPRNSSGGNTRPRR
jgi:hypothetical protein